MVGSEIEPAKGLQDREDPSAPPAPANRGDLPHGPPAPSPLERAAIEAEGLAAVLRSLGKLSPASLAFVRAQVDATLDERSA